MSDSYTLGRWIVIALAGVDKVGSDPRRDGNPGGWRPGGGGQGVSGAGHRPGGGRGARPGVQGGRADDHQEHCGVSPDDGTHQAGPGDHRGATAVGGAVRNDCIK